MAKAQGNVFKRAKSERKKHPRKFKTWAEYVVFAAKKVKAPARKKRKVTGKNKTARKKVSRKKPAKRKARAPKRKTTVATVKSVTRTVGSKKRRRAKPRAPKSRRRSVSGKGHSGLLIGLAVAAGAYFLLSGMGKTSAPTTPYAGQYGTLNNTVNPVRNTQSQDIINYAIAAGLAADTIADLIDRFNSSSDDEIKQVYDYVNTTGDIQYYA